MKYLLTLILSVCFASLAIAITINMQIDEKHGVKIPEYKIFFRKESNPKYNIIIQALADSDNFPISSVKQGSVFLKILEDIDSHTNNHIDIIYDTQKYSKLVQDFEIGKDIEFNALFGVYYEQFPYSKNQYIYPAIMTNNVHLITSVQKTLELTKKDDLKKYKGMHIQKDKVSTTIAKEFVSLNLEEAEDFDEAYEALLTGKVDYILASYYPSLLSAYTLGIKKYIAYSKEPLWKMPIFIRCHASIKNRPEIKSLSKYFSSAEYKKLREEIFEELVEIYRTNTSGVVPPTYIKYIQEENATQNNDEEQILEK